MLRRYCQVGAEDALTRLPAWEVDLLLEGITEEIAGGGEPAMGDDLPAPALGDGGGRKVMRLSCVDEE